MLYNNLSKLEKDLFYKYLKFYGEVNNLFPRNNLEAYLRLWNKNKQVLYHLLDKNFIIEKEIEYDFPKEDKRDMIVNHVLCTKFFSSYKTIIDRLLKENLITMQKALELFNIMSSEVLIDNIWLNSAYVNSAYKEIVLCTKERSRTGKELKIVKGQKIMRFLGKFAKEFDLEDQYEEFRKRHSEVLNLTKVKGTLCLSIHPLDFVTMSDNNCDWDSCMAWRDGDPGEYRIGTIACMNSPYVLVAYLKASDDMHLFYDTEEFWSNKKWRQLVIVNENIILGNKQYPYDHDYISTFVLDWVKELAIKNLGYNNWYDNIRTIINNESNEYEDKTIYFSIHTDLMYNDIYGGRKGYVAKHIPPCYYFTFDSVAICAECLSPFGHSDETSSIVCSTCQDPKTYCCDCNEFLCDDEAYYDDNGYPYCERCYWECHIMCDSCGIHLPTSEAYYIEEYDEWVCNSCYNKYLEEKDSKAN